MVYTMNLAANPVQWQKHPGDKNCEEVAIRDGVPYVIDNGGIYRVENGKWVEQGFFPRTRVSSIAGGGGSITLHKSTGGSDIPYESKTSAPEKSQESNRICFTEEVSVRGGGSEYALMSPVASIMPGMIFDINSILTGDFIQISNLPRASMDLQIMVIAGGAGNSTQRITGDEVNAPLLIDKVREVVRKIGKVQLPFNEFIELEQMKKFEELEIKAGASYSGFGQNVKAKFAYSSESTRNTLTAYYVSKAFDMIIAAPKGGVRGILAANAVIPKSAVVVEKVSFGKIVVINVETELSKEAIDLAVNYNGTGFWGHIEANFDLRQKKLFEKTTIRAFCYGAENSIAAVAGGTGIDAINQVREYIRGEGRTWDVQGRDIPPIAYQLRFLDDESMASISSTFNYKRKTCVTAISKFSIQLMGFVFGSNTGSFEGHGVNLFGDLVLSGEGIDKVQIKVPIPGLFPQQIMELTVDGPTVYFHKNEGPYSFGKLAHNNGKPVGNLYVHTRGAWCFQG